jgi:hypothetical protein
VRGAGLGGDEPAPIDAETARGDGLSWNRLWRAVILLNSVSTDKQVADSSAKVSRVHS